MSNFSLLQHNLSLIALISGKRLCNGIKVFSSFYLSRLFKKVIYWGNPLSISIEPTNLCNLACPECPTGLKALTRRSGMVNIDFFTKIIDQIYRETAYLTLYFQGEPFLNPDFFRMVEYARKRKIYVMTSTNAHYLTEKSCEMTIKSGLNKLIVSIDGSDQQTYEYYRKGGQLSTVLEGVKRLTDTKKRLKAKHPFVMLQFIVFRQNEHQIEDIRRLAKEMGVDHLALKTAQVYDYEKGKNNIPENIKYSRYKRQKDGTYRIKNKFYNHCWRSWQSCVVTWDGQVVPCCFDKDAKYNAGSLKEQSFQDIWKGNALKTFRQNLLKNRKDIDICQNCIEGTKIWI